ncbi:10790_t:CDS:2 [Diversispora eburnea]|uniref:10790_t:CDS:1 n=1 Tax=Diversispora eburnea TaxID=1213867 RepID=A0A9N8W8P4_9GLOM|nr:10790_t:CDS:2 [Diversispora eburnea]
MSTLPSYQSLPPQITSTMISNTPPPTSQKGGITTTTNKEITTKVIMEQFAKRCKTQLERRNYIWLDTVKILTAGVIEMENDIAELERARSSERGATKPWTVHYK